ncbi:Uncharacterised protein [Vibrio cholerae]|nr:Uncharacterised protein [Vibrio cholerae]CSC83424.1 Uncharacterised protein [Vibrio cholerae]
MCGHARLKLGCVYHDHYRWHFSFARYRGVFRIRCLSAFSADELLCDLCVADGICGGVVPNGYRPDAQA